MLRIAILLILFFAVNRINAQNTIALPEITNFSKQSFNAGTQTWSIRQDDRGIIYCANNEGLLSFDGSHWKKYVLPNETIIRSLYIAPDKKIYIGAQGEIGYFFPGSNGNLQYHSLADLIPEKDRDFADVWEVKSYEKKIFFRSNKRIFQLENDRITVFPSMSWQFMGCANGLLLANDYQAGLMQYSKGQWVPFHTSSPLPKETRITAMVALNKDSTLITTLKHGIFILHGNLLNRFRSATIDDIAEKNIYTAAKVEDNLVAIGTNLGGCYFINQHGQLVQRISKIDGLQNNNVLSIFLDKNRNIWLGLDNGIDHIAYNNAIKHIIPDFQERSAGYASIIYKNNIYIGTCFGLYKAPLTGTGSIAFSQSPFRQVPNSKGQVWGLSEVNGQLLMGHNEGFYVVNEQSAQVIDGTSGFWSFMPISNSLPSPVVIAGTYNGVNFYNYNDGRFSNPSIHSHFESARFIVVDDNIAWVAHPYKGLYKVDLNNGQKPAYTVYKDHKGILSRNRNHLFKVKSRIILTTDKGVFEYNRKTDDFEPSEFMNKLLKGATVQYLREDDNGNVWFVENKHLGVVDLSGPNPNIIYVPELDNKIMTNGFEFVYPYDNNNVFVAGEEGFYVIDYAKLKGFNNRTPVLISNVRSINRNDSILYGGYAEANDMRFDYSNNSLHFEFSAPVFGRQTVEYSYYLEGFENDYSVWSKKNEKEYTNLPAGTYEFKVRSRKYKGDEASISSFSFVILPPWYRTNVAYLFYFIVTVGALYALYKWTEKKFMEQQERYEEEQKKMQYLHQLEIDKNESEIIRLRNEKLEAELMLKEKELASTSMNLVQKDEMLVKVKEEFVKLKKDGVMDKTSDEYRKIIRMLEENKVKENWDQYAVHFDKVHSDFIVSLQEHYPNLTPSELKLCSYLRLNLSSKEIANIMNITIKSVELSRYRLRKKLKLDTEVNLCNFMLSFHSRNEN